MNTTRRAFLGALLAGLSMPRLLGAQAGAPDILYGGTPCGEKSSLLLWDPVPGAKEYRFYATRIGADGLEYDPEPFLVAAAPLVRVLQVYETTDETCEIVFNGRREWEAAMKKKGKKRGGGY